MKWFKNLIVEGWGIWASLFALALIFFLSFSLFPTTDLISNFWANLLADSAVAIFFGLFLVYFTDLVRHPHPVMMVKQSHVNSSFIRAISKNSSEYEFEVRFLIYNQGRKSLKADEGYWHIYIDGIDYELSGKGYQRVSEDHLRDNISLSVFPRSFVDLNFEFKGTIEKGKEREAKISYFFSTEYGRFPRTVPYSLDGLVPSESFPEIPIKFE